MRLLNAYRQNVYHQHTCQRCAATRNGLRMLFVFALLSFLAMHAAVAQITTAPASHFGVVDARQGLPNNIVFRITQDRQGFLWFATMDGLARYDGYAMRVWKHNPDDSTGLASSDIRCLLEDSEGMLWIGTQAAGVHRFDPHTETFKHFYHRKGDITTLDGDEVAEIFEDNAHRFWILSGGTLHLFDRRTGKVLKKYRSREAAANPAQQGFTPLRTPLPNTLENAFNSAYLTEQGELWVSGKIVPTDQKTKVIQQWGILDTVSGKITPLFANAFINSVSNYGHPYRLNDTTILATSVSEGMFAYNPRTHSIHRRYLPDSTNPRAPASRDMRVIYRDRQGRFWINSIGGGLMQYHPQTDDFTNYRHDPNNPTSLPFSSTLDVYEDRRGILWVGTPAGAAFYDARAEKFTPYTAAFPETDTGILPAGKPLRASTRLVFSIRRTLSDPNALWICATAEGGLLRFNTKTESFTRFWNTPAHPQMLPNNNIYTSFERPDGILWLGLRHGGFVLFDPRTRRCRERYLPEQAIFPVLEDSLSHKGKRYLWAGNLGAGLHRLDVTTKEFKNYTQDAANPHSFIGRAVFWANFDKHGRLWFGSINGLSLYRPATDDFENFVHDPTKPRSLSCSYVECVVEDSKGRVWVGTEDGLNLFNEQTREFTRFGVKDGLPSAVILGIVEDKHGNIWLSTNQGISCFNPEQKTFRNYDETDGLHGNTFNSGGFCTTADGRIWFGGVGGFTGFHPDSLHDNTIPPPVVLTEFRKFNKTVVLDSAIGFTTALTLDYKENYFSISYAALNFTHPEKNRYKYKLEGFDGDWIDAGTKREANYTNLDGGEYVFRVIACNNDGVWNTEGARLRIIITPPFWETRWFLAVGLLTVIGATASGMGMWNNKRLGKQHREHELETIRIEAEYKRQLEITRIQAEAQAHKRERIFRDIHDGLGAHIVEIAAMTEQLRSELPPPDEFLGNTTQNAWVQAIMISVHDLRSSLREIVWLLNMENDSLEALVSYLRLETSRVLENASLTVAFSIDDTLPDRSVNPEVRRNIVMAVREATSNVIKHAEANAVVLSAHYSGDTFRLIIKDNGRGFEQENVKRFSNGTKTMQKRMALCGGTMAIDSATGTGTTVVFSVPI